MPLRVATSSTGWHSKSCRALGSYQEQTWTSSPSECGTTHEARRRSGTRKPRCSSRGRPVCRRPLWVASRLPSKVSNFKTARGTSLEPPSRERASSSDRGGTTWFFSSLGGILEYDREFRMPLVLAREVKSSIRVAKESWGLLSSHCRANRPHLGLCPEANVPLQGRQGYRGCIPDSLSESDLVSSGSKELRSPFES